MGCAQSASSSVSDESSNSKLLVVSKFADDVPESDSSKCKHHFSERWKPREYHCCDCRCIVSDKCFIDEEERIIEKIVDNSIPSQGVERGVPISFLVEFADKHNCWDMTTRDVRRRFVMPKTRATRCRYVELPEMSNVVAKANIFVSHAWGAKFGDLVAALCDGGADKSKIVWVDIFAVRQWPSHKPDLDFSAVVKQCKAFLIVISSLPEIVQLDLVTTKTLDVPFEVRVQIAFLRVWCLVEIHAAVVARVAIVMKGGSFARTDSGAIEFRTNSEMLSTLSQVIDINKAEASVESDKERILAEISASVGVSTLNEIVRGVVYGGYMCTFDPAVQNAACGDHFAEYLLEKSPAKYLDNVINCGYDKLLQLMITRSGVTFGGISGKRQLLAAAERGHTACVELILRNGMDVNVKDFQGMTALMFAAKAGFDSTIAALLHFGADINAKGDKTALMYAAENGHTACVDLLIKKGADLTIKIKGSTALTLAKKEAHMRCVELLEGTH